MLRNKKTNELLSFATYWKLQDERGMFTGIVLEDDEHIYLLYDKRYVTLNKENWEVVK